MNNINVERLQKLQAYYLQHGVLPSSYSKIAKIIGYKAKSAAFTFVEHLKSTGHLSITPENSIKPGPRFNN